MGLLYYARPRGLRPARGLPAHAFRANEWTLCGRVVSRVAHIAGTALLLLAGLAAWAAPPKPPAASLAMPSATRTLYVVGHGWHTGIVLRAADVPADAWPARADFPDAQYLEVGWGNRDYYQARDPGVWLALKAISWPAPGVLHVVAFDGPVERYFGAAEVIELRVSEKGLQKLIDHVRASHELDAAGRPIQLGPGLYGRSRFYASSERFHLFKTCNVWVAVALREAGLPVAPAQSITAEQLLARLRPLGWVPGTGSATCASLRRIYSPCGGFMVWRMG